MSELYREHSFVCTRRKAKVSGTFEIQVPLAFRNSVGKSRCINSKVLHISLSYHVVETIPSGNCCLPCHCTRYSTHVHEM